MKKLPTRFTRLTQSPGKSERGSQELHDRILEETLILLGREAHRIGRFFRNETGVAYRDGVNGERKWISYGVKGSPDIYGILIGGRYIGLEIKSGQAVQQANQKLFETMVKNLGGFYFVVRSSDEALDFVLRAAASSN